MHQSSRDGRTLILSFKFQDQLWTLRHWPPFHLHCLMNSPGKGHWCRGTGVGTHHCKDFFLDVFARISFLASTSRMDGDWEKYRVEMS